MNFMNYRSEILDNVRQNYSYLINKNGYPQPSYVGCGSTGSDWHIYLVLICTLPLFKKMADAQSVLVEHFSYARFFENYDVEEKFSNPKKTIQFLNNFSKSHNKSAQAFIFNPDHLERVIDIMRNKQMNQTSQEIVFDILNKDSPARSILHRKTIKRIQNAKTDIIDRQWNKAKKKLCACHLLSFLKLIWKNLMIRLDTHQLVKELEYCSHYAVVCAGEDRCGNDVISVKPVIVSNTI